MGDIKNMFCHTGGGKSLEALKEHLLKVTLRLPHGTNARKLDAPVRGTHGGTFSRLGIRVTAVGERRAFEALGKGQTGDSKQHFARTASRATGDGAVAGNGK